MSTHTLAPATLDDLMKVDGRAELIGGRIVHFMPSGYRHGNVARLITRSLENHVLAGGRGEAIPDNVAYGFPKPLPSGRQSFSPDSSFYTGRQPVDPDGYIDGTPDFAVEVRSKNDHGPAMDREYEAKRNDYFTSGTLVVWDVNPRAGTVTRYRKDAPTTPVVFARGDIADAEPAVPGWRLRVDDLFA